MLPELIVSERISGRFHEMYLAMTSVLGVSVRPLSEAERREVIETVRRIAGRYGLKSLKDNPVVRAYRDFYWRIGIDPTKQRPSSEALLRRVLRGRGFPNINNVVDACNLASIETLVPIGLYDMDLLEPPLVLRYARNGEVFKPIGGELYRLGPNEIVIADGRRVIHVYPHRDSAETAITPKTRNVLVISLGAPLVSVNLVRKAAELTAAYIERYAGGVRGDVRVIRVG